MPALVCALGNVVFDVAPDRPLQRWREANGGLLGVGDPRDLDDRARHAFETGALGESEYARHLRATLLWQGDDRELVEIFADAFGPVRLDVVQLLADLRAEGWTLVGVMNTNPWQEPVWRELYGATLAGFDRVLTSTALGLRVGDPRFLGEAVRDLPTEGMRLFVDDDPRSVAAARTAGFDAHLFRGVRGLSAACQALAAPAL